MNARTSIREIHLSDVMSKSGTQTLRAVWFQAMVVVGGRREGGRREGGGREGGREGKEEERECFGREGRPFHRRVTATSTHAPD